MTAEQATRDDRINALIERHGDCKVNAHLVGWLLESARHWPQIAAQLDVAIAHAERWPAPESSAEVPVEMLDRIIDEVYRTPQVPA